MRTPILQSIIEIENLKICKTILIDECTSVGAALYGTFIKGNFPVSHLKNIIPFNPRKEKNSNVNKIPINKDSIIISTMTDSIKDEKEENQPIIRPIPINIKVIKYVPIKYYIINRNILI